jgi:hypothetical protein
MGQKCDDFHVVPLCRRCHDQWHQKATVYGLQTRAETVSWFWETQAKQLVMWLRVVGDARPAD